MSLAKFSPTTNLPVKWRAILSVVGGFLVHFTLGTLYTFGNMNPYLTSYIRYYKDPELNYSTTSWIFAMAMCGQGCAMWVGGLISRHLSAALVVWLGAWTMSMGVIFTYFSLGVGLWLTIITYGVIFGVGVGLSYSVALASAMSWFPLNRGLVGGIVVAGFGGGSFVFNFVQTSFVNPNNLHPNITVGDEKFFDQEEVLHKVPQCFLLIGLIYAAVQLLGAMLISTAPKDLLDEETPLNRDDEGADRSGDGRDHINKPLLEVIKTREFIVLWCTFFFSSVCVLVISTLYKSFGELIAESDHFLATVGSVAAVFNACGRIVWGMLHDRFQYKLLMLFQTSMMAVLLFTFTQTNTETNAGQWMYLVWVCCLFGSMSGIFALFPAIMARTFGVERMGTNYGLLFSANAIAGVLSALVLNAVKAKLGWFGVFAAGGGAATIGFLSTLLFPSAAPICSRKQ